MRTLLIGLAILLGLSCATGGGDPMVQQAEPAAVAVLPELLEEVEQDPSDARARRRLALALHEAGRKGEALPHFETLVELDPAPEHLIDLARCYATLSRMPEAEATYRRLLEASPGNAAALYDLGNIALARDNAEEAIELYGTLIDQQPQHLLARHNLGAAFYQARRFREAYRAFEKVLELEPANADELQAFDDSLFRLGALDLQMGATERSIQFFELFLEAKPDHADGHYLYGQALAKLGRTEDAERIFERHKQLTGN